MRRGTLGLGLSIHAGPLTHIFFFFVAATFHPRRSLLFEPAEPPISHHPSPPINTRRTVRSFPHRPQASAALVHKLRQFVANREASEEAFLGERTAALAAVFAERFVPLDGAVADRLDATSKP